MLYDLQLLDEIWVKFPNILYTFTNRSISRYVKNNYYNYIYICTKCTKCTKCSTHTTQFKKQCINTSTT